MQAGAGDIPIQVYVLPHCWKVKFVKNYVWNLFLFPFLYLKKLIFKSRMREVSFVLRTYCMYHNALLLNTFKLCFYNQILEVVYVCMYSVFWLYIYNHMSCDKGTEVITRRAQCLCEYVESGNLFIYYIFILYISNRNEALNR